MKMSDLPKSDVVAMVKASDDQIERLETEIKNRNGFIAKHEKIIAELESLPDQTDEVKRKIEVQNITINRINEDYKKKEETLKDLKKLYNKE
ncbi:hypothetical protein Sste5346_009580 [Sporothrix stenoceras]|uniref:Uncharacterized protein n=1 Tax=Sporothrix stenoceras TaxID=5173 RepID=A0ABR3YKL5_9PEZI